MVAQATIDENTQVGEAQALSKPCRTVASTGACDPMMRVQQAAPRPTYRAVAIAAAATDGAVAELPVAAALGHDRARAQARARGQNRLLAKRPQLVDVQPQGELPLCGHPRRALDQRRHALRLQRVPLQPQLCAPHSAARQALDHQVPCTMTCTLCLLGSRLAPWFLRMIRVSRQGFPKGIHRGLKEIGFVMGFM